MSTAVSPISGVQIL